MLVSAARLGSPIDPPMWLCQVVFGLTTLALLRAQLTDSTWHAGAQGRSSKSAVPGHASSKHSATQRIARCYNFVIDLFVLWGLRFGRGMRVAHPRNIPPKHTPETASKVAHDATKHTWKHTPPPPNIPRNIPTKHTP